MSTATTTDSANWPGDSTPAPHESIRTGLFGTEVVLHDRRSDVTHQMNPAASAVWLCLDGKTAVSNIVDELAGVFGAPRADVEAGVRDILSDLNGLGALRGSPDPGLMPALQLKPVEEPHAGREVMPRPPDP